MPVAAPLTGAIAPLGAAAGGAQPCFATAPSAAGTGGATFGLLLLPLGRPRPRFTGAAGEVVAATFGAYAARTFFLGAIAADGGGSSA
jgi:hypothetical protein